jgi:hypothetical protein
MRRTRAHARDVDQLLDWWLVDVSPRRFRDIDGEIADPFEIAVDLDRCHDGSKVGRHRLIQRQQPEAAVVDFDVELIERFVTSDDAIDQDDVARHQPVDRHAYPFFREAAHLEQAGLHHVQFFLKVANGSIHQPNLPVT